MTDTEQLTRLGRVRRFVRGVFTLGIAVSLTANVLHANPNPISQGVAAWAPLALLLAVELIVHTPVTHRGRSWLRLTAVGLVAGIAAWVSYWHMVGVANRYGETGLIPYLLPISVDGLIVVASISLVEIGDRLRQLEQPATETTTVDTSNDTDAAAPAPANAARPAIAIPADTAARLAAAFNPPAPDAIPAPATRNGHQAAGNLAQEPLL